MKKRTKALITGVMAFTLMFSGFFGTLSKSVYAEDGVLTGTSTEMSEDVTAMTNDVSDNENAEESEVGVDTENISENDTILENKKESESEEIANNTNETEEKNIAATADNAVAIVDGNEYSSVIEAINSISNKGTVKIVSDVELLDNIVIADGKSITLTSDENKHIIMKKKNNANITVEQGGELVIDSDNLMFTSDDDILGGLILCHGKFTLNSGVLDLQNKEIGTTNVNGIVQVCGANAQFIMNGGKIQNAKTSNFRGGVRVCCNAEFIMNGGTISGIDGGRYLETGAVLVLAIDNATDIDGSASFEMNGGTIENNSGYRGAGVFVKGREYTYRATMVMNGGIIQHNTCTGWTNAGKTFPGAGAGIYIERNAIVTMNGGNILNNTVNGGMGGGIATADGFYDTFSSVEDAKKQGWTIDRYSSYYPAGFIMNGGTISGNEAKTQEGRGDNGCGGGIYIASDSVTLKGGIIENNESGKQGGGVYVGSIPYRLTIYDAIVKGNVATTLGGGVWACPTGDTEVFVTNGVGIYDNTSLGAGDDVVSVKTSGIKYVLTLANRILGGGQVLWYKDGGIANDNSVLGNPNTSPRYNSSDTPITEIKNSVVPYALKAIVSDSAKKLAEENTKLFIRNNKSARGGGIGTNGGVIMGEKDNEYTLKVKKDWKDTDDNLKQSVTVYLKVGDTVLDPVILNEENNWKAEFKDLPAPNMLGDVSYAVVENPVPENFTVEYQEAKVDEDNRMITIDITNTYHAPKFGGLTVEKEVTGTHGDKDREFHFTVTLDNTSINGTYGGMDFKDGVAEITLKHGDKVTATGLPAGIGYIVTEKEANADGYTTSATADKGTIPENDNVDVKFVNHKENKPEKPDNPNKPDNPETGDQTNLGLYASMLVTSSLLLTVVFVLRRKKRLTK